MQHFDAGNYHLINIHTSVYSFNVQLLQESCIIDTIYVCMEITVVQCVTEAAMELGYSSMKPEQVEVAVVLIEGRDVFAILPTGLVKATVMLACQWRSINSEERAGLFHCRCSFPSSGHHERPGKIRKWMLYL